MELKPNSEKKFLTPTKVAAFLGVGRTSIYRYIRNGKIKAVRFAGKTLVRRSDINKMFDYIIASKDADVPLSTVLRRRKRPCQLRAVTPSRQDKILSLLQGVNFTCCQQTFSGSKIDRQFSYLNIDQVLRYNALSATMNQRQPQAESVCEEPRHES